MKTSKTTSSDIRQALFGVMEGVLNGSIEIKKANSAVKAASSINQSVRFDIEKERLSLKAKRSYTKIAKVKPIEL